MSSWLYEERILEQKEAYEDIKNPHTWEQQNIVEHTDAKKWSLWEWSLNIGFNSNRNRASTLKNDWEDVWTTEH
jgi:hypothetical protein